MIAEKSLLDYTRLLSIKNVKMIHKYFKNKYDKRKHKS